jgi:type I restriction enzyme S subunit
VKYKPYPEYKPSGVEWIGDIPVGWEVKKIKWDTPVLRGASPRPIDDPKYFDDEGEYAWVRISDVTNAGKYLEETTEKLSSLGASLSVKLKPGDLFLSIAGSVGKACLTKIKCCIHDGFVYFPRLSANKKYLYWVFASGEAYKGLGKLGTQLNLNTDTVASISIGFPPNNVQQQIANFLDQKTGQIDDLIQKKEKMIKLLKEKRAAIINQAITKGLDPNAKMKPSGIDWIGDIPQEWDVFKLKYLTQKIGSGITPKGGAAIYENEGIPLLRSQNIHFDALRLDDVAYISEEIHQNMIATEVHEGDVLFNITGASIGRCNYWPKDIGIANVNQHVCIVRPSALILTKYLYFCCPQISFNSKYGYLKMVLREKA